MKSPAPRLLVLFALLFALATSQAQVGQESENSTSSVLANSLIARLYQVAGWSSATTSSGVVASGRMKVEEATDIQTVTISAVGVTAMRYDVQSAIGSAIAVVSGSKAAKNKDGQLTAAPAAIGETLRVPLIPFLFIEPGSDKARFLRQELINGQVADVVETASTVGKKKITLWIAHDSGFLLQAALPVTSLTKPNAFTTHIYQYSGYSQVGGVFFPMHQEEFVNGKLRMQIDFVSVQFADPNPALFEVPNQ